jgi:hypothetical protein
MASSALSAAVQSAVAIHIPGTGDDRVGLAVSFALLPGPVYITPQISLDVHTLIVACISILVGTQVITFGILARRYASSAAFCRLTSTTGS